MDRYSHKIFLLKSSKAYEYKEHAEINDLSVVPDARLYLDGSHDRAAGVGIASKPEAVLEEHGSGI